MDCISSSGMGSKKIFIAALRKKTFQLACWPESESHRVAGLIWNWERLFSQPGRGTSCSLCWTHRCPGCWLFFPFPIPPFAFFWDCITRYKQRWELLIGCFKTDLIGLRLLLVGNTLWGFFAGALFLLFLVKDHHSLDSWIKQSSVFCTCDYIVSRSVTNDILLHGFGLAAI